MIKTLQKKLVRTAMIAVTVLIVLLLGAINIVNMMIVSRQVDITLQLICENEGDARNLAPLPNAARDMMPPGFSMIRPKNDYDTVISSNFFVVRFSDEGEIAQVDISRTSAVTETGATELAQKVYESGRTSGKAGAFRYLVQETRIPGGKLAVFLDTSGEVYSYVRTLTLSASVGLICWSLMLIFVILLSRRAIRPIAENIEKQKQFVTNAGHEIKTPLAIIQSNTEAMELYNGENKWSKNIREQTVRLSDLMKNLLMLARMDEGAAQTHAADFSVSALIAHMVQSFALPMEMKGITLQTAIQPDVHLHADKGQIEQLISILLDNAVKYANENGQITIGLQKSDKRIRLQVENTCESLPGAAPDKLFDRFYRADTARTQKSGGYGIGLSVAQSIAAANKGTISVEYIQPSSIRFSVKF